MGWVEGKSAAAVVEAVWKKELGRVNRLYQFKWSQDLETIIAFYRKNRAKSLSLKPV